MPGGQNVMKQTGHWPSRRAAVSEMRARGYTPAEAFARLKAHGLERRHVDSIYSWLNRRDGLVRPCRKVLVPVDVIDRLRAEATIRGEDTYGLVARILTAVVEDDLVDAVLDDEAEPTRENGDGR